MQLRLKDRLLGNCSVYRGADVEIVANEVQGINTYDVPAHRFTKLALAMISGVKDRDQPTAAQLVSAVNQCAGTSYVLMPSTSLATISTSVTRYTKQLPRRLLFSLNCMLRYTALYLFQIIR